ncbi:MAG: MBL fold metallo-hydrolase [Clostridiales bacterium]|nr:MBL fold metallo-hydrolase [Clostridiales bacterium]
MIETIMKFSKTEKSWDEILRTPCNILVDKIFTGYVTVKKYHMIKTHEKSDVKMPVYCYIIRHKSGNYLIDAGLDMSHQTQEYGMQRGLFKNFLACSATQEKGDSIGEYLKNNNIKLKGIFITHMHFDHTAGLIDLPEYDRIIMSKDEPKKEHKPFLYGDYFRHIKHIDLIDFESATKISPLGGAIDFFGDGSLFVIDTYGHSAGHISFVVNSKTEPQFIASDAYIYESDELTSKGPGKYTLDYTKGYQVIKDIIAFGEAYPNVKIVTGHGKRNIR